MIKQKRSKRISTLDTILITIGVIAVIVVGIFVIIGGHSLKESSGITTSTAATTTKAANLYAVLSPASVPSKAPECNEQIAYSSNGNSGPLQCSNGYLNAVEWNALAALEPSVMTLGYTPTAAQVQAALCKDAGDSSSDANTNNSSVIETTTYQISALYYGWSFSPSPTVVLTNGGCK